MWKKAGFSEIKKALSFVSDCEYNYMSITSRFYKKNKLSKNLSDTILIKLDNGEITGIVLSGKYGLLAPLIKYKNEDDYLLADLIISHNKNIHSIMGDKTEVEYLFSILKQKGIKIDKSIDYLTMTSDKSNNKDCSSIDLNISEASIKDINKLMPLQKLYEIEEVLLNKDKYNYLSSFSLLKSTLKKQIVFFASDKSGPVAKANTNAIGINYYQIGGVFVLNDYRNMGIGKTIVNHLLKNIISRHKKACLFVKKSNLSAIKLYSSLGFKIASDFKIIYLY